MITFADEATGIGGKTKMRMKWSLLFVLSLFFVPSCAAPGSPDNTVYDVVVYGGTSSGVMAAVQVARMGKQVVLIEPGRHLGGLSAGGLGATDIGNKSAIGGLARTFYNRIFLHYSKDDAWIFEEPGDYPSADQWINEQTWWKFEPHVAEKVFNDLIREAGVQVVMGERLDLENGIEKEEARISSITMESGSTFQGQIFIDATYEGDLMAMAGVSYAVGRESNELYNETLNGVQTRRAVYHQFTRPIDPFTTPGDPASGLLPGVHGEHPGEEGRGDCRVQAYNFRMCLTDVPKNRVPFPRPAKYDPSRYELLLRHLHAGWDNVFGNHQRMPNRKTDTNNKGAFSTDNIGMNYDYPNGDYAVRERIIKEHETYQKGLMWFLANDPRVPEKVRGKVASWGLAKDEFVDNGHWPHQLYIREARRMKSDYMMTEHNCRGTRLAEDPVGLGAYGMDSHNTQRYVDKEGHARNEGDIQIHGFMPYPISFRSIVPKQGECENLLVPVCVSSTHIAFGSIRMEPVFMVLGQSAGTAAVQAIEENRSVQGIDYSRLRERLLQGEQVLAWQGRMDGSVAIEKLEGVVIDDRDAILTGSWISTLSTPLFVENGYLHDGKYEIQLLPVLQRFEHNQGLGPLVWLDVAGDRFRLKTP